MAKFVTQAPKQGNEGELESMIFKIEGLHEISPGVFGLSGVKPLNVEWQDVEKVLTDAGVEKRAAMAYTEEFAGEVTAKQLAAVLAKRMERVG